MCVCEGVFLSLKCIKLNVFQVYHWTNLEKIAFNLRNFIAVIFHVFPFLFSFFPQIAYHFQENLLRTMIQIENTYFELGKSCSKNCLIICDRGVMDASACKYNGDLLYDDCGAFVRSFVRSAIGLWNRWTHFAFGQWHGMALHDTQICNTGHTRYHWTLLNHLENKRLQSIKW